MNDEIKKYLDSLYYQDDFCSENYDLLLDYITNLQQEIERQSKAQVILDNMLADYKQENERLKKILNCKEYFSSTMPEDTEFVILTKNNYDRQQKDIQFELIDYKYRCEKAIEYINKEFKDEPYSVFIYGKTNIDNLLNILQNGSEE